MSAVHRRAARREQQTADILGAERKKYRNRFERAPDMTPVRLPSGDVLQADSKTRAGLPKWMRDGLAQCRGYSPGCVPVVVVSQTRGEPIAVLPLRDLVRLLGIQAPEAGRQLGIAWGAST